jgi:hypothetical protein
MKNWIKNTIKMKKNIAKNQKAGMYRTKVQKSIKEADPEKK